MRDFTHMVQESQTSSFCKLGAASTKRQPVSWNQTLGDYVERSGTGDMMDRKTEQYTHYRERRD